MALVLSKCRPGTNHAIIYIKSKSGSVVAQFLHIACITLVETIPFFTPSWRFAHPESAAVCLMWSEEEPAIRMICPEFLRAVRRGPAAIWRELR